MKIVADREIPFVENYFGACGELVLKPGRFLSREDVLDADLLLVRSVTEVNENLLQGTAVKWVGTVTTGVDHLDTAWLDKAGIRWASAAGYNATAVSDYVMALIAALYPAAGFDFSSLKAAVVGVGRVGSRVAERLKRLGFQVLFCDPPRAEKEKDFKSLPLKELSEVDFLSLHTPLIREGAHPTYHLIDEAFLKARASTGFLVNSSRGAVVDFAALPEKPTTWRYCFDVWEREPAINTRILASALLATPHIAGYTVECRYRGVEMIYRAACEQGFIQAKDSQLPRRPRQSLSFEGKTLSWQEVLLSIFNPMDATHQMKAVLLKEPEKCATLFDSLRRDIIGEKIKRHEFASTELREVVLAEQDRYILEQLGFIIKG